MPLHLEIDYDRGIPVYRQIYEAVTAALASGALQRDEQLPTIHELAARLEVNPNTVSRAYRELEQDGFIVGKRGLGTFPLAERPSGARAREGVLRAIFERATAEAARHGISTSDMIRFFQRMSP